MYCRKCGTPNPDDRANCLQCNAPLARAQSGAFNPNQQSASPTQTTAFPQPSAPTVVMPPSHQTGPQTPTTGPIVETPRPAPTPSNYQPMQTTVNPSPVNYGQSNIGAQPGLNMMALISVICGGVSFLVCCMYGIGVVPAAVGMVLGFLGMKKVQTSGEKGRELAIAGIVVGGVGILTNIGYLIWVIFLVVNK